MLFQPFLKELQVTYPKKWHQNEAVQEKEDVWPWSIMKTNKLAAWLSLDEIGSYDVFKIELSKKITSEFPRNRIAHSGMY